MKVYDIQIKVYEKGSKRDKLIHQSTIHEVDTNRISDIHNATIELNQILRKLKGDKNNG